MRLSLKKVWRVGVLALLLCALPAVVAAYTPVRAINGSVDGRLKDFLFSPNGRFIVFRVVTDDWQQLIYSAGADGRGSPVLLGAQSAYERLLISPDSDNLLFMSGSLIGMPLAGGAQIVLAEDVTDFAFTPDGRYVVYTAWRGSGSAQDLFVTPVGGGMARRLNPRSSPEQGVTDFAISPDSRRVVFSADLEMDTYTELYSAPLLQGSPVKLNQPLDPFSDIIFAGQDFQITPDGATVVYRATAAGEAEQALFAVPVGGGKPRRITLPLEPGAYISRFSLSPDGGRAVYETNSWTSPGGGGIYSAPVGGGIVRILAFGRVDLLAMDPDGHYALVRAIQTGVGQDLVSYYLAHVPGGSPRFLGGPFPSITTKFPEYSLWRFAFSPDGGYVAFQGRRDDALSTYVADVNSASAQARLLLSLPNVDIEPFQFTADSRYVVQIGTPGAGEAETLLRLSLDGEIAEPLVAPPLAFAGSPPFQVSPDGFSVAFGVQRPQTTEALYVSAPYESFMPLVR